MAPPLTSEQEQHLRDIFYGGSFFGRDRLYHVVRQEPDNKISRRQVMDWLAKQEIAQTFRRPVRRTGVRAIVSTKLGRFQADILDMSSQAYQGYVGCLSMIDTFSKKLYLKPVRNKTAASVTKALQDIIRENPGMKITSMTNDNGHEFQNEFSRFLEQKGIKQHFIAPHQPWSNGIVERSMATIRKQLSMWMKTRNTKDWVSALPNLVERVNNTMSFATKKSPDEIERATQDSEVQKEAGETIKRRAAKGANVRGATILKEGDIVKKVKQYSQAGIKKASKTGYFGKQKYTVVQVVPSPYANQLPSYKIQAIGAPAPLKGLVARWQLLHIPSEGVVPTRRPVEEDDTEAEEEIQDSSASPNRSAEPSKAPQRRSSRIHDNEYELEYIAGRRKTHNGRIEWLVHWADGSESWEPTRNLSNAKDAINDYLRLHPIPHRR